MHIELVIAKLITLVLGLLIAYQAFRGYQTHRSAPMLYVAIGFAIISIGAVIEGVLFDVVGWSIFLAGLVQTLVVAIGMLFVLYSLYGNTSF
ncbi:DUF7521 family protein [Haloarchaeobius sp. HME9146]|uniref:DUF7521 family protein n=1 Tax=unclassified Haloarchaeobius TaxID=2614452 RepID=UPI0021BE41E7|nr:hypothetical protein [Haloarchaeobius sp. HME9146]MCT9095132.1 hypothetical protein [Haloarchaeobius sp. HME9146]